MIMLNNPKNIGYANPFAGNNNDKMVVQDIQALVSGGAKIAQQPTLAHNTAKTAQEIIASNAKDAYRKIKSVGTIIDFKA